MKEQVLNRPYSKSYEWRLVIIFFFCWGFIFLDRMVVGFITPTLAEVLQLSFEKIGNLTSVTNICYAIATVLFGIFASKIKRPRKWLIIFSLGTGIVAACCMLVQNYSQLLVLRGAIGALEGPISPLILLLTSRAASEKSFGLDVGIINMGVALIAFTFGPIFAIKSVAVFGWQVAFLIVALPSIIVAIAVFFTIHEIYIEKEAAATGQSTKVNLVDLLKYRNVIMATIVSILLMAGYWCIIAFGPMYMTTICGYTQQSLSPVMTIIGVLTIIYVLGFSRLTDYFGRKPVLIVCIAVVAAGTFIMGFFPINKLWSLPVFTYIIIGGMIGGFGPIAYNIIPVESVPLALKATSCGIVLGSAEIIGGAIFPKIGGIIADTSGLPTTFIVLGVLLVIGFVTSFFIIETLPSKVRAKEATTQSVVVVEA